MVRWLIETDRRRNCQAHLHDRHQFSYNRISVCCTSPSPFTVSMRCRFSHFFHKAINNISCTRVSSKRGKSYSKKIVITWSQNLTKYCDLFVKRENKWGKKLSKMYISYIFYRAMYSWIQSKSHTLRPTRILPVGSNLQTYSY